AGNHVGPVVHRAGVGLGTAVDIVVTPHAVVRHHDVGAALSLEDVAPASPAGVPDPVVPRPALDVVVAGATVDEVRPRAGLDEVVAPAAVDLIVSPAGIDPVAAAAGVDGVVALVRADQLRPGRPLEDVVPPSAQDGAGELPIRVAPLSRLPQRVGPRRDRVRVDLVDDPGAAVERDDA